MEILKYYFLVTILFPTVIWISTTTGEIHESTSFYSLHDGAADSKEGAAPKEVINWCYDLPSCGEETWPGSCKGGGEQSPIDLPLVDTFEVDSYIEHFPKASYNITGFTILNNGHALEILPKATTTKLPQFFWPKYREHYRLHSVNFRWGGDNSKGSEHAINSIHYPLELQLVHYNIDFPGMHEALESKKAYALAVLSVLFRIDSSKKATKLMAPITRHFPKIRHAGAQVSSPLENLDFPKLFQGGRAYSYKGSLTIPPCEQNVAWLVWEKPVDISSDDVGAFRTLLNNNRKPLVNNFRQLKKSHSREIEVVGVHYSNAKKVPGQDLHKLKEES